MYQEKPEELNKSEEVQVPEPQPVEEQETVEAVTESEASNEPETAPEQEDMPEPKDETPVEDDGEETAEKPVAKETEPKKEKETAPQTDSFFYEPESSEEELVLFSEGDIPDDDEDYMGSEYTHEERRAMLERMEETMSELKDGELIKGKVLRVNKDEVVVDIGFKSEGIVSKDEFSEEVNEGDEIEVFLEQLEDENGQVVVSKRKADFMRCWNIIKDAYEDGSLVIGNIRRRIKGGMVVDVMGVEAFLPGSQIALRQVPDFDALLGKDMEFRVIKLNKIRRNIVVSRRVVLEEERSERRQSLLGEIEEDQIRKGVVKNITDFGVFIDLGGLDGLLHITDMSWTRIKHPSEVVNIGDEIDVKILKFDRKKERISLGLKQLTESPWEKVDERFPEGSRIRGKAVNLTKYGAFVELEEGIEGLVHVSEMSWTKHINHPSEVVNLGDEIDVIVLNVDKDNQKISLGVKQLEPDPWTLLSTKYPPGSKLTGKIRNLTSFGAFVEIEEGIDGLIHISDMSWTKRIMHPSELLRKGQEVEVVVLNIDAENRRVSLGLKQMERDPWPELEGRYSPERETEGRIIRMSDRGVAVKLPDDVEGFVPVTQLGKEVNRPQDAFAEGDLLPLKVIEFDRFEHRIVLSVNAFFDTKEDGDLETFLSNHPTKTVSLREALGEKAAGFDESQKQLDVEDYPIPEVPPEFEAKEEAQPEEEKAETPETEETPEEPAVEETEELVSEEPVTEEPEDSEPEETVAEETEEPVTEETEEPATEKPEEEIKVAEAEESEPEPTEEPAEEEKAEIEPQLELEDQPEEPSEEPEENPENEEEDSDEEKATE
ncbi:MAG TPA: 30S ribosomal protein S1 [candidate division Zixibacteria bacterium]|nr:30S ribosomal protein S1 [candidate division Zixibacteria bacterium]